MIKGRKISFSATQPSGNITLGNSMGALRRWPTFQGDYDCIYCVVDEHAITVRQNPADLRHHSLELFAQLIACGIDPERSILFIQSFVPAHVELAWVLNCFTMFGELNRMTQFKEKSLSHADNINAGLFTYPTLMAADILLYQADVVPVGEDQRQHVELCRDIAIRFNGVYGDVFTVPEAEIPKTAGRVMSLQEPEKKMSKSSDNENSYILVMDSPDVIMRKFKRAVTDSQAEVRYDPEQKPGVSNLMDIYAGATGLSMEEIRRQFEGKGYGEFKTAVGEATVELLRPVRENTLRLMADKGELERLMKTGAEKAAAVSSYTMNKVRKKVGFLPR